jgi:hypothetical protein
MVLGGICCLAMEGFQSRKSVDVFLFRLNASLKISS